MKETSCLMIALLAALGTAVLTLGIGYGVHQKAQREDQLQCQQRIEAAVDARGDIIDQTSGTWNKIRGAFTPGDEAQ